jgi:hypothetical protein
MAAPALHRTSSASRGIAIEHCASAKPMRFARSIFRPIGLQEVQTFECGKCGLAITAEAAAEVLETTVQFMPA